MSCEGRNTICGSADVGVSWRECKRERESERKRDMQAKLLVRTGSEVLVANKV